MYTDQGRKRLGKKNKNDREQEEGVEETEGEANEEDHWTINDAVGDDDDIPKHKRILRYFCMAITTTLLLALVVPALS